METTTLNDQSINNLEYQALMRLHKEYDDRLIELSRLTYPTEEEQWEEIVLKKKKLAIKDQMYSMILNNQKSSGVLI
jgi:uncharacterized protein YdcH (DUF465 family)